MGAEPRGLGGTPSARAGFLLDENIPAPFARALQLVGYHALSVEEVGLRGAGDSELIDYCAAHGLVWVTKDLDARKRAAYTVQVKQLGISACFLAPPRAKHWTSKEQFEVLARNMRTLEVRYRDTQPRFFFLRSSGQPREVGTFAARPGR